MNAAPVRTALEARLVRILAGYAKRPDTCTVRFALASPRHDWSWEWAALGAHEQYFIASVTKLFVSAIMMQLRHEGRVDLDRPAVEYLGRSVMDGIHVRRGVDAGARITVRHLLAHTSGIADYFEDRRAGGRRLIEEMVAHDVAWSFADVLRIVKGEMQPKFPPGMPGRAHYSDTNYQLLGALIEAVTAAPFERAVADRILAPLGLHDTYLFTPAAIGRYHEVAPIRYGQQVLERPKAMASTGPDGGIVSTARDCIAFLRAFVGGELFPAAYLEEMQREWHGVFGPGTPLAYGTGLMRFALPRWYSPLWPVPAMIGHSGATGAVLYYAPKLDLYMAGTTNQIKNRSLPYTLLARLAQALAGRYRSS